eukprot:CAMPEP_0206149248 /NCGR_PEP_ID=MMETSP1473-20131121/37681_1 /ASSEMBLY_ACC=CAM_ASM_001109 /TAXON_ID=1461547 /ORGANISM="Stichococcus sp, Strain RCC1054" /LENGTH=205 /DNA_ID=CAMNT_0053546703 /DNA_START=438 /DNA_END=1052 /DNA_ORIENTATION=-
MSWRRLLKGAQTYIERVKDPVPPTELPLFTFASAEHLKQWNVFTDAEAGGSTNAKFENILNARGQGTAAFQGQMSRATNPESRLQRSGFCGINRLVENGPLDLENYDTLAYRVRGDGRRYIASLRTENWVVGDESQDVWQAFLFARKNEWAEVEIPLARFLQTWKGRLVDNEEEMNPGRIVGLGISVAASPQEDEDGTFRLDLDW